MINSRLIKSNDSGGGVCTSDITDIFEDSSGVALYQLNWDGSDMSGNYNGVATNVSFVNGHIDSAGSFNGSTSKIGLPVLNISGSQPRTISAWINTSTNTGYQTIYTSGINSDLQMFTFSINGSLLELECVNAKFTTASGIITTNIWHHVSVVYNGGSLVLGNVLIYLNGVSQTLTKNGALSGSANTSNSNYAIGYWVPGNASYFNGDIDQVRIFNKAISASEVSTLYAEAACAKTCTTDTPQIVPDCIAYYKLDGNATDSNGSGTLYDGTATNVSWTQGRFGSAVQFTTIESGAVTFGSVGGLFNAKSTISVSLWFNSSQTDTTDLWVFNDYQSTSFNLVVYFDYTVGKLRLLSRYGGSTTTIDSVATNLNDGNWHHLVIMTDISNLKNRMYVDDSFQSEGTLSSNDYNGTFVNTSIGDNYTGSIDQVKIFDRAITAAEVTTLYNEVYCKNNDHFNIYTSYDTGVSWNTNVGDNPQAIRFNNDGTAVYVLQFSNKRISQFNLSTAYDISTASGSVNDNTFTTGIVSFFFNSNGTKLYTVDFYADTIYEHNLSTAYLVSSASSAVASIGVSAKDNTPFDIFFKPDGSKMYFLGLQNKSIYEYNLSTLYSLSSATFANSYNFNDGGFKFTFNSTGTKFYKSTPVGTDYYIYEYYLDTAWDISSSNFSGNILQTSFGANGLVLSNDDLALIILERFNNNSAVAFEYLDE